MGAGAGVDLVSCIQLRRSECSAPHLCFGTVMPIPSRRSCIQLRFGWRSQLEAESCALFKIREQMHCMVMHPLPLIISLSEGGCIPSQGEVEQGETEAQAARSA